MTISRVQSAKNNNTSSSASVSFGGASTTGSLLIAIVALTGNGVTASTPSGFSLAVSNTNADGGNLYLFIQTNANSITTITSSLSGSNAWIMFIGEYSGVAAVDSNNSASTPSGGVPTVSSGSLTTSSTNDLFVAALDNSAGDPLTSPSNGFSLVQNSNDSVGNGALYADLIATSSGSFSTSCGSGSGGNGLIVSFTAIGGGGALENAIWFGSTF